MTFAIVAGFAVVGGGALAVQWWAQQRLHRIRRARYGRG